MSAKSPQPVFTPAATPRVRQTQGIALVVTLLAAMILMVSMLAITSTMVISSQRTTADQGVTSQAQYAAEAGVARATSKLAEIDGVVRRINVTNSTRTQIEGHIKSYCNGNTATFPSTFTTPVEICKVGSGSDVNRYSVFTTYVPSSAYPSGTTASTYWPDIFGLSSASAKIVSDKSGSESWYTVSYRNATSNALAGPLTPKSVRLLARNSYRFEFEVTPTRSDGEVRVGDRVVAARRVQQQTGGTYYLDVLLPSYARNFIFRDVTTNLSGGQLYFAGGESFGGPVHTNGTPGFAKVSGEVPVFTDDFSSCASGGNYSGYSASRTTARTEEEAKTFQGSTPQYGNGRDCIELPTNSNNQKRAAFGGDPSDTATVTEESLQAAWGVKYQTTLTTTTCRNNPQRPGCTTTNPMPNSIYYSKGNGTTTPNQASSWNNDATTNIGGGIHVKGDVDQLKLCANGSRQVIGIRQGTTLTTFEENVDAQGNTTNWTVKVRNNVNTSDSSSCTGGNNGTAVKTLSGKFNGMVYVDGNINDMRGDGTTKADLAPKSKLMVTSTGKVLLKDDITYVDMPSADRPESEVDAALKNVKNNVLGIYSSGEKCDPIATSSPGCGSILADGLNSKDLNIHASIMATKDIGLGTREGEGFGAVRNNVNLGAVRQDGKNRKVQIKLFGGIIEKQSQTVGDLGSNGYSRNYKYDRRFRDGFAPPFFPEQAEGGESAVIKKWETRVGQAVDGGTNANGIGTGQSVWQTVGK